MTDVRIDTRGVPKGPVYEEAPAVLHRQALTAVDGSDPAAAAVGVNCTGYRRVRFDIDTSGSTGLTALKVQLLSWSSGAGKYFRGAEREFSEQELSQNPLPALEAEVRGATVFLKVVSASAVTLLLSVYATPS
ncbi:MAG TPA: hypothetical protein VM013_03090 [Dehalococcoidia bacterium]|nr:hypothetical protein [Dehalococcoidia bacterium]